MGTTTSEGSIVEVVGPAAGGNTIQQDLSQVAGLALDDVEHLDQGQYRGLLFSDSLLDVVRQPSVMWLRFEPQMDFDNDQSKNHMKINTMRHWDMPHIFDTTDNEYLSSTSLNCTTGLM